MSVSVVQLAQPIIEKLATLEQIEGILCFGSSALGITDIFSDIDLYVFSISALYPRSAKVCNLESNVVGTP
jgi:hypothetical protein